MLMKDGWDENELMNGGKCSVTECGQQQVKMERRLIYLNSFFRNVCFLTCSITPHPGCDGSRIKRKFFLTVSKS